MTSAASDAHDDTTIALAAWAAGLRREAVLRSFEITRDHSRHMPKKADFSVASVLPDDFVDRFAIVGDPELCADRFREIMSLGVNRITVLTRVPTTDREETNTARLADTVLSQLA